MERIRVMENDPPKVERIKVERRSNAGRPKGSFRHLSTWEQKVVLAKMARQHTRLAIKTIVELCEKADTDSVRLSAAKELLDRAYGKAPQAHTLTGPDNGPVMLRLDQEQLQAMPDHMLTALETLVMALQKDSIAPLIEHQPDEVTEADYEDVIEG